MSDNFKFVEFMGVCEAEEGCNILIAAHYHLMKNKRYWSDSADKAASTILCVLASDTRAALRKSAFVEE